MFFNRRKQNLADSIGNSITDLQLMFVVSTPVVGVKSVVLGTEGWGGGCKCDPRRHVSTWIQKKVIILPELLSSFLV